MMATLRWVGGWLAVWRLWLAAWCWGVWLLCRVVHRGVWLDPCWLLQAVQAQMFCVAQLAFACRDAAVSVLFA